MSTSLSKFSPIPQSAGLWSAQKGSLRCTALRLRDGSLCLYSPVLGLGDSARNSLAAVGNVSFLLAPNHYHHRGLAENAQAFPEAVLVCAERAKPRLEKQTHLSFERLDALVKMLPNSCEIVAPDGLKTGEVWLVQHSGPSIVWVVCDAFKGPAGKADNIGTQIELLSTFPTYGVLDKSAYSASVQTTLAAAPPTMVAPCHGAIVLSETLVPDIKNLLDELTG